MMTDALRATKSISGFHDALQIHLVETSPVLKQKQAEQLSPYTPTWHSDLKTLPSNAPIILIGNEFLDALPVSQLVRTDTGWNEKHVKIDKNGSFRLFEKKAKTNVTVSIPQMLTKPKLGDHLEVSLEQKELINTITEIIINQSGTALFIDYGFVQPIPGETLQAVKKHSYCSIFDSPGEVDLTAHVNFSHIAHLGMEKNITVHGTVSQGDFLKRLGIEVRANQLTQNATTQQAADIQSALTRLTGTGENRNEMGNLFKVIAFSSDPEIELSGFTASPDAPKEKGTNR